MILSIFKKLLGLPSQASVQEKQGVRCDLPAPELLELGEAAPLLVSTILRAEKKFAAFNWDKVNAWAVKMPSDELRQEAYLLADQAWVLHLRDALGPDYYVLEDETNVLLSSLDSHMAQVALTFMNRAKSRVQYVLGDMAQVRKGVKDVLIICRDEDDYYHYVSNFYGSDVEIARSGGMFLNHGCPHFLTMNADLSFMEVVIVHELTHNYLGHLPLPVWLNEGLAMNVERRLTGYVSQEFTPQEMVNKHQAYWNEKTIAGFWSGQSFKRQESMTLSYDLATQIVAVLAKDWEVFSLFVQNASDEDAGFGAAKAYLHIDLEDFTQRLLGAV